MKAITKKLMAITALVISATLVLAGCATSSTPEESSTPKIAVFTVAYGTPAFKFVIDDLKTKGTGEGWDVTINSVQNNDFDKLNSDMVAASTQGYKAFILAGFDPRAISVGAKAAKENGIPLFAIDGDVVENPTFALDTVSDQTQMAQLTTDALIKAMGGAQGKNVMIIGFDPSLPISTRSAEAAEMLKKAGANVVAIKPIQDITASVEESLSFVKDYIQANPGQLDGVWTGLDPAAIGATKGVMESGANVPVTGIGEMGALVELILAGSPLVATSAQDWTVITGKTVDAIKTYLTSGKLPASNFDEVPVSLIDKSNAASVKANY